MNELSEIQCKTTVEEVSDLDMILPALPSDGPFKATWTTLCALDGEASQSLRRGKVDVAVVTEVEMPETDASIFSVDGYTTFLPVLNGGKVVEDVRPADNISINGERMEIYGPLVRASPMKYVVPKRLDVNYIRQGFQVYEDDLWIVTPPKCGTTWTQEIVWLLLNNVDLNAAQINQFYRIPFLELASIRPKADQPYPDGKERNEDNLPLFQMHSLRYAESMPRPRVIKTHLPLCMLPEKLLTTCKVVFVARNVMDMAVSYYYHTKLLLPMDFPFEEFAQVYKEGGILQTPMIPMILEAWQQRDHPHMCFLTFENMKLDTMAAIRTLQKFLGVHLEEKKLEQLHAAVQFESLKKNTFVNKTKEFPNQDQANGKSFIRKGIIGDWKNHFSQDMRAEWAKWARDQLKASDYDMVFE
eukprot:snap_masked-scaffold217_size252476-processed-gene-0.6 protein:Tk00451 transcript:snap_masked-scaffold217_size252476-processed-gene-0.6-mRNA-1 annotation:"hypothetical protein DAPPUDRAFT_231919"